MADKQKDESQQKEQKQRLEFEKTQNADRMRNAQAGQSTNAPKQQSAAQDKVRQARMKSGNYPKSPAGIQNGLNSSKNINQDRKKQQTSREDKNINRLSKRKGGGASTAKNTKGKLSGARVSGGKQAAKEANKAMQRLYTNGFRAMVSVVGFIPIFIALWYAYIKGHMLDDELFKFKLWQEVILWFISLIVMCLIVFVLFIIVFIIDMVSNPLDLFKIIF